MAKKNEQPSIKVEPRPTDGKRNGFLAEEKHLGRRGLLRLGTWGIVAVGAVTIAVFTNETSMKQQRDEAAAVDLARQSQQIQAIAKESQNETRRLAAAINTLNNDRDRLFARVTVLEEGLDSVTGSIAKQSSSKAAAQPSGLPTATAMLAAPATPAPPSPQSAAQGPAASPLPPPLAAPVATEAPKPGPEKPVADAKPAEPPRAKMVAPEASKPSSAPQPVTPSAPASAQSTSTSMPLKESKAMIGPPAPAAQRPTEPPVAAAKAAAAPAPLLVASATPEEKEKKASAPIEPASSAIAVNRTEFGVDLGGANSVPGLRALWRGLVKIRANAPLLALQPIIMIRESNNELGMQLRLVAGPFNDAAAAAQICAGLAEHHPCETTVYDGQRLALKPGDEPAVAAAAPARPEPVKFDPARSEAEKSEAEKSAAEKAIRRYPHRRFYAKKLPLPPPPPPVPPVAAQEPPKQEPSSFSSFFHRTQPPPPPIVNGS